MGIKVNYTKLRLSYLFLAWIVASPADAYIDPGTTGLVSQLLYVLFYGFLGVFIFCIRYIKQLFLKPKRFFERFLRAVKN